MRQGASDDALPQGASDARPQHAASGGPTFEPLEAVGALRVDRAVRAPGLNFKPIQANQRGRAAGMTRLQPPMSPGRVKRQSSGQCRAAARGALGTDVAACGAPLERDGPRSHERSHEQTECSDARAERHAGARSRSSRSGLHQAAIRRLSRLLHTLPPFIGHWSLVIGHSRCAGSPVSFTRCLRSLDIGHWSLDIHLAATPRGLATLSAHVFTERP
jgi:hypothetical protein